MWKAVIGSGYVPKINEWLKKREQCSSGSLVR
jgi:hypothetical protein